MSDVKARSIECTLAEYHARPEWSRSQLEVLHESAALFCGRFVDKVFPSKESSDLDVGTVAHAAILDEDGVEGICRVIPREALNDQGHRKGAAWRQWSEDNADFIQLKQDELDPILHMVRNVFGNPAAEKILVGDGQNEFTILWTDEETGLQLRCRPDRIADLPLGIVLADVKTTRATTPREFANDAVKFGYHRQAAWYIDGAIAFGFDPKAFIFIVVNKTPAHECEVYSLAWRAIEQGRAENRAALRELALRLETGNWNSSRWGDVYDLDLPEWAYKEDQYA